MTIYTVSLFWQSNDEDVIDPVMPAVMKYVFDDNGNVYITDDEQEAIMKSLYMKVDFPQHNYLVHPVTLH